MSEMPWWLKVRTTTFLSEGDMTDALVKAGREHDVFRQCSIGYHEECSDTWGDCECPCHPLTAEFLKKQRMKGRIP